MTTKQKIISALVLLVLIITVISIPLYIRQHSHKNVEQPPETLTLADGSTILFDGNTAEWEHARPTYTLATTGPNTRNGKIWVDQVAQGLIISGSVDGGMPQWPEEKASIASGDHIEVWLADAKDLEMPAVGWGHQFGDVTLSSEDECDNGDKNNAFIDNPEQCKTWYQNQVTYRDAFKKLFIRQWQLAPDRQAEVYSAPAFASLSDERLTLLRPSPIPLSTKFAESPTGYTFEMIIPWEDLPPIHALQLKDIRLLVDIFNPGESDRAYGSLSSTSNKRKYAQPSTFNTLSLFNPQNYSLTACRYEGKDVIDKKYTYFIPNQTKDAHTTLFTIGNEILGYQYSPYETSRSPAVFPVEFFEKSLDAGVVLCGPELSMKIGDKTIRSNYAVHKNVEVKKLANGNFLVKQGPDIGTVSLYGTGACGSCPVVSFNFYYVDTKKNKITSVSDFDIPSFFGIGDMDYTLSDDWKKVTIYSSGEDKLWNAKDYCFNEDTATYTECGSFQNVGEPQPRTFSPFPEELR